MPRSWIVAVLSGAGASGTTNNTFPLIAPSSASQTGFVSQIPLTLPLSPTGERGFLKQLYFVTRSM
jgi:hypothetical protein